MICLLNLGVLVLVNAKKSGCGSSAKRVTARGHWRTAFVQPTVRPEHVAFTGGSSGDDVRTAIGRFGPVCPKSTLPGTGISRSRGDRVRTTPVGSRRGHIGTESEDLPGFGTPPPDGFGCSKEGSPGSTEHGEEVVAASKGIPTS
jgi:hypothetical protein